MLRQLDVGLAEFLAEGLAFGRLAAVEDAHEVDHRVLASREALEHAGRVDVGLDHIDRRQQDQVLGTLAAAGRHRGADALRGKEVEEVPPDEAGSPDDEQALGFHAEIMAVLR